MNKETLKGWKQYRLNDLFIINPPKDNISNDTEVSFIAMKDVSDAGYLISSEVKRFEEVKNGYTYFKNDDIILAKITPCFENGKMAVLSNLTNNYGVGSTEFYVFRKRPNANILPQILYYIFKEPSFRKNAIMHMSGAAGQKRVQRKFLEYYPLSIPLTTAEQQEIVQVLDTMSDIIRLREECISHAQDLIPALFQEMFKNYENNTILLSSICDIKGGKRLPSGEKLIDAKTEHPYLRVTNFKNQNIDMNDIKYITEDVYKKISRYVITTGDIYISIAGTIGLVGDIPNELNNANLTENAARLIIDKKKVNKKYLIYCLNSTFLQQQIKEATVGVGVPKLALSRIGTLKIYLPDIKIQEQFAQKAIEIESYIKEQNEELKKAEQLFQSLLHHAFTGELTSKKDGECNE